MRGASKIVIAGAFASALLCACASSGRDDSAAPAGSWYLSASGQRSTVTFDLSNNTGTFQLETSAAPADQLDSLKWDEHSGSLVFRRNGAGFSEWYRGRVVAGVFVGRLARSSGAAMPPPASFVGHFSGWSDAVFSRDIVPRVFEVATEDGRLARLRLDRAGGGQLVGCIKVYATRELQAGGEALEYDLAVSRWDGRRLEFTIGQGAAQASWSAQVSGRHVSGSFTAQGKTQAFTGERAEVLTHGLERLDPAQREAWQRRTRAAIEHLMMAGNPAPATTKATILTAALRPIAAGEYPPDRDDDPDGWQPLYHLSELQFDSTLADPQGGAGLSRRAHGYLAIPDSPPPAGGFPVVIALNGHGGSAGAVFDPTNELYHYGDSYARRGFAVLALDMGHRPLEDRAALYADYLESDDPFNGNGPHPAIKAPGQDSDWEEDGERVWDVMRAIDYLQTRPDLNGRKLLVTGLSMGGEITTLAGALDPRVTAIVAAGFSPDFGVMLHHGNHPCWQWQNADLREYFEVSDLHALAAPRPLLVETGRVDPIYSSLPTPYAADKQIARRSRAAYGAEQASFVHYLHYDGHHYHFGDVGLLSGGLPADVQVPVVIAPLSSWSPDWEVDATTRPQGSTVFDFVRTALALPPL